MSLATSGWPERFYKARPCFQKFWKNDQHFKNQDISDIECDSHLVMSDSLQPMDCNLPGSSVHGILQARIPEWVAIRFSRGSSQPRDQTPQVSCIADRFFTVWATINFP